MGCLNSHDKEPVTGSSRRRLSLTSPGGEEGGDDTEFAEADRGLITALDDKNIIQVIDEQEATPGGGRKMSIGSNTDDKRQQFSEKKMQQYGDDFDPQKEGVGFQCRKGLKPESPNQDSWFVLKTSTKALYAVFDGHGQKGHDISNFVKENLPKLLLRHPNYTSDQYEDIKVMMLDTFKKTQTLVRLSDRLKKLSAQLSGTTATVVLHDTEKRKIHVAHVADSTAVLGSRVGNTVKATALTRDHKPDLKDERARIESNGGRVIFDGYANHRVYVKNARYPGLNMSRCLGDLMGHKDCGLSAEPEITEHQLKDEDELLLVCSDGVWEFISPKEAVDIVIKFGPAKAKEAAEKLAKEAWDRWIREEGGNVVDDITVILVYLNKSTEG